MTHVITEVNGSTFAASCSCGWKASERFSVANRDDAVALHIRHSVDIPVPEHREPVECLMADAMLNIMRNWMPENGESYKESSMLWGAIWKEMLVKSQEIMEAGVLPH